MAIDSWAGTRPEFDRDFEQDAGNATAYLLHGLDLLGRLPAKPDRSEDEQGDAQRILQTLDEVRDAFLTRHTRALYARADRRRVDRASAPTTSSTPPPSASPA